MERGVRDANPGRGRPSSSQSQAIDGGDLDPRRLVDLLGGIEGALESAQLGLRQVRAGDVMSLDEL
jgi:hypothetical protein